MYEELIAELQMHHCDAKEDDTQEVCEECAYDVIIADKSVPNGIASVCVCGLMHRAADAIEELQGKAKVLEKIADKWCDAVPKWIHVTERLPEKDQTVLAYCAEDNFCYISRMHQSFEDYDVTHWIPLPQMPESEGE